MTMEHPPFEDVFPIEHGDFPMSHQSSGVQIMLMNYIGGAWKNEYGAKNPEPY